MKKRLNILCILVFIVLGLSLYTTGYQFGTGMKAGMSLAKEQHKEPKQCDGTMPVSYTHLTLPTNREV